MVSPRFLASLRPRAKRQLAVLKGMRAASSEFCCSLAQAPARTRSER
jgi:hypothetical protein